MQVCPSCSVAQKQPETIKKNILIHPSGLQLEAKLQGILSLLSHQHYYHVGRSVLYSSIQESELGLRSRQTRRMLPVGVTTPLFCSFSSFFTFLTCQRIMARSLTLTLPNYLHTLIRILQMTGASCRTDESDWSRRAKRWPSPFTVPLCVFLMRKNK